MNPSLTTAAVPLPAADEQYQLLDMREVWEELAAALHHIENLPRQHPDDRGPEPDEPPPIRPLNLDELERWK
ncbi:hypothetical protein ACIOEZ_34405 [Streptomyces sp. NPDC087866]|uniref:hypothetical protein n=1 Tax=Streptomyces sp. NPDC087866 TaxID=3365815 RepID=UPI00381B0EBF